MRNSPVRYWLIVVGCSVLIGTGLSEECSGTSCDDDSLRLEFIKAQILRKLNLKEAPTIENLPLPDVLREQLLADDEYEASENFTRDDFFGKTHEVIIFANDSTVPGCRLPNRTSIFGCYQFLLTQELSTKSVASAVLWVHSPTQSPHSACKVIQYLQDTNSTQQVVSRESFTDASSPEWLKFSLTETVRGWLDDGYLERKLLVTCDSEPPDVSDERKEPFLIIRTDPAVSSLSRRRRYIDCTPNTTACCRVHFHVNFKEIGWKQWIIKPDSYNANYCRGECNLERSAARYYHTSVLQEYLQTNAAAKKNSSIALCCSPARLGSLTMIYMTQEKHVYRKVLPNMIAESCDCA